jgi:hypothetical protein
MKLPEGQQPIIYLKRQPHNFNFKILELLIMEIIVFIIPFMLTIFPQSIIHHNLVAIVVLWTFFGFLFILLVFIWVAYRIEHLKIYESGVVLRSSVFLIKRYIPYEKMLDVKLIKGNFSLYAYAFSGRQYHSPKYLAITTKKLNRYEIWEGYIPDYRKALLIIKKQLRLKNVT